MQTWQNKKKIQNLVNQRIQNLVNQKIHHSLRRYIYGIMYWPELNQSVGQ